MRKCGECFHGRYDKKKKLLSHCLKKIRLLNKKFRENETMIFSLHLFKKLYFKSYEGIVHK